MCGLTVYTDEELKKIQELEKDALQELIRVCEQINVSYFLIDGAAIGAVRHNGFIPWDDDIDVGMLRDDYRRFLAQAPKLLSQRYELQTPYIGTSSPYFYAKMRIKGTEFVEYCNRKVDMPQGVYIDLCPFDEVPDNERQNKRQFQRCRFLIRLFTLRQSPELSAPPATVKRYVLAGIRWSLHHLMRLIPYQWMAAAIEKATTQYNGSGQSAYAFLHHPKWKTDYIRRDELFPLEKGRFDGIEVRLPHDCNGYLTRHYGDYRRWPEPEERYGHKPYRVKID